MRSYYFFNLYPNVQLVKRDVVTAVNDRVSLRETRLSPFSIWRCWNRGQLFWLQKYQKFRLKCLFTFFPIHNTDPCAEPRSTRNETWSNTGAMLYQLSYEASHRYSRRSWVRIPLKPWLFQASSFQLLKLENSLRWSLFTFIYYRSANMNYFILLHVISLLTGDINSINWPRSQCVAS